MGKVAVELKVMPSSPDVDLEKLKKEISKLVRIHDSRIEPLAFGLKVLSIVITLEDSSGGTEKLENAIKKIDGVGEVEVINATLI